jgi:hypothetical protein
MKLKYGILDDFGEVIRWVWDRPVGREYIVVKIPPKPKLDTTKLPEALW